METSTKRSVKYWGSIASIPVVIILFISGLQLHLEDEHSEEGRFSAHTEQEGHFASLEKHNRHHENDSEEIRSAPLEEKENHEEGGWEAAHQIWALLFLTLMVVHIYLHWNWFKTVIGKFRLRNSKLLALTVVVFTLMVISGFSMFFHLVPREFEMGEIHFRLGIVLMILILIHIVQRFKWIISITRKMASQE